MAQPPEGPANAELQQFGYRQELSRSLSLSDLLIYGLILMVPIAPFGIFGSVYTGSGGMVALAYLIGMVAMATRDDGISLLSTLVNFGAMTAFLALHVAVVVHYVVRGGSRDWLRHLVVPVIGFLILLYVVINADIAAQVLGFVWLGIGALVLIGFYLSGRRPELAGLSQGDTP